MMNIIPQVSTLSVPTVLNPPTESLRRENNQREIITKPAPTSQSAAEKGVSSDKERGRTPAQNNANIDFASIREQAELANSSISEQNQGQSQEQKNQDKSSADDPQNSATDDKENTSSVDGDEKTRAQTIEQGRVISELKIRDQEVRAHESAHASVGGSVTGTPNFSYEQGPDGKRYAVGGEVSVDLSSVKGDPKATIAKMQKVYAAALAPVNPSAQDTRIASIATQQGLQAQSELLIASDSDRDEKQAQSSGQRKAVFDTDESLADNSETGLSPAFDVFINKTLASQEAIAPSQSVEVVQRALRIESFYSDITQAYEKPPTFQFELTA